MSVQASLWGELQEFVVVEALQFFLLLICWDIKPVRTQESPPVSGAGLFHVSASFKVQIEHFPVLFCISAPLADRKALNNWRVLQQRKMTEVISFLLL